MLMLFTRLLWISFRMDGACRHIAATLFDIMEFLGDEQKKSVTSGECIWIRPCKVSKKEHAVPIKDLKISIAHLEDPMTPRVEYQPGGHDRTLPDPDLIYSEVRDVRSGCCMSIVEFPMDEMENETFPKLTLRTPAQKIMTLNEKSGLSNIDNSYDDKFLEVLDILSYTDDERECISRETEGQHINPNWHSVRKGLITASNVKLIYSCRDQQKTARKLINGSTLNEQFLPDPIKFGRTFEDKARNTFQKSHHYHHRRSTLRVPGIVLSKDTPFLGASPDGVMDCKVCGLSLIEVKCFYSKRNFIPKAAMLASNILVHGNDGQVLVNKKHPYYFQIQTQMAVTGIRRCTLVGYTYKGIHTEEVKFDSTFWDNVLQKLVYFYKHHYLPLLVNSL